MSIYAYAAIIYWVFRRRSVSFKHFNSTHSEHIIPTILIGSIANPNIVPNDMPDPRNEQTIADETSILEGDLLIFITPFSLSITVHY